jgi:hypothetical protein
MSFLCTRFKKKKFIILVETAIIAPITIGRNL